jgi:hypothetical protein
MVRWNRWARSGRKGWPCAVTDCVHRSAHASVSRRASVSSRPEQDGREPTQALGPLDQVSRAARGSVRRRPGSRSVPPASARAPPARVSARFISGHQLRGQRRHLPMSLHDLYPVESDAGHVGEKLGQPRTRRVGAVAKGGRGGDEAHLLGAGAEGVQHPPQQQGQLGRLGAHVAVGLVDDDPAQPALRTVQDRPVLVAHQHVLQHGGVGDQRAAAGRCAACGGPAPRRGRLGWQCSGRVAVVEAESQAAPEGSGPGDEPLLLALDERVQRIEKDRANAGQRRTLAPFKLAGQIVEDRDQEALRLAGAGAAC